MSSLETEAVSYTVLQNVFIKSQNSPLCHASALTVYVYQKFKLAVHRQRVSLQGGQELWPPHGWGGAKEEGVSGRCHTLAKT